MIMKKVFILFMILTMVSSFFSCRFFGKKDEIKLIPVQVGDKFEYIDLEGKIIINPQFEYATLFHDGLALVSSGSEKRLWGYINEEGKFAISPIYKEATVFNEGLAWVVAPNAAPKAINQKGDIVVTLQNAEKVRVYSEGLAAFSVEDSIEHWGFVDNKGKVVITPQFKQVGYFSDGKCAVQNKEEKWGYINKEGKLIINCQFEDAAAFHDGQAVVEYNDKFGTINEQGKYVINPQFDGMISDEELFIIVQDKKWGWCDKTGKIIINPQFEEVLFFGSYDLAPVNTGEMWGYVDKEGKIQINPQFDYALSYFGKLAPVVSGEKIGFIDKEGKFVVNPQFDDIDESIIYSSRNIEYIIESYGQVISDYFNVMAVIGNINLEKPEGFSFSSSMDEILKKFNIKEDDFNIYMYHHTIKENVKIGKGIYKNFYVRADATKSVQDGWYSKSVYDPKAQAKGFEYIIDFKENEDKIASVFNALRESLSSYKNVKLDTEEMTALYTNSKQSVEIWKSTNNLIMLIYPISEYENYYGNMEGYSEEEAAEVHD